MGCFYYLNRGSVTQSHYYCHRMKDYIEDNVLEKYCFTDCYNTCPIYCGKESFEPELDESELENAGDELTLSLSPSESTHGCSKVVKSSRGNSYRVSITALDTSSHTKQTDAAATPLHKNQDYYDSLKQLFPAEPEQSNKPQSTKQKRAAQQKAATQNKPQKQTAQQKTSAKPNKPKKQPAQQKASAKPNKPPKQSMQQKAAANTATQDVEKRKPPHRGATKRRKPGRIFLLIIFLLLMIYGAYVDYQESHPKQTPHVEIQLPDFDDEGDHTEPVKGSSSKQGFFNE